MKFLAALRALFATAKKNLPAGFRIAPPAKPQSATRTAVPLVRSPPFMVPPTLPEEAPEPAPVTYYDHGAQVTAVPVPEAEWHIVKDFFGRARFVGDLPASGGGARAWALLHGASGDTNGHIFRDDGWMVDEDEPGMVAAAGPGDIGVPWRQSLVAA